MLRALCHVTLNALRAPAGRATYSIDATSISKPLKKRQPRRIISTLRPDILTPCDYFDFSNLAYPNIWSGSPPRPARIYYVPHSSIPFPPNTRGFPYLHSPSSSSIASAGLSSIRLRLTPTPNPASFPLGTDLLNKDRSHPWSIPFLSFATRPACRGLREILLRDGTTNPKILHDLQTLSTPSTSPSSPWLRYFQNGRVLRTLDEPFALDLAVGTTQLYIMARGQLYMTQVRSRGCRNRQPYTGIIKVRFEVSTLPEHERSSHLVYRVVEIVKPVECAISDYGGHVPPPKWANFCGLGVEEDQ